MKIVPQGGLGSPVGLLWAQHAPLLISSAMNFIVMTENLESLGASVDAFLCKFKRYDWELESRGGLLMPCATYLSAITEHGGVLTEYGRLWGSLLKPFPSNLFAITQNWDLRRFPWIRSATNINCMTENWRRWGIIFWCQKDDRNDKGKIMENLVY